MKKFFTFLLLTVFCNLFSYANSNFPVAGRKYYIVSDNWNNNQDVSYYLYDNNGTLATSTTQTEDSRYVWTCEKQGENYRFKNGTGKYLGFKVMSNEAFNFSVTDEHYTDGCVSLKGSHEDKSKYLLVSNSGAFDQATKRYNKKTDRFSSDFRFILKEENENEINLNISCNVSQVPVTFTWNGQSLTGSGTFVYTKNESIQEATLTATVDPASIYQFDGFYEGEKSLGKTVEIASLTAERNLQARFSLGIFSQKYGDKWIEITWANNKNYKAVVVPADSYEGKTPKTSNNITNNDAKQWCFVGNKDGFKIYNKLSGPKLSLGLNGNIADGTASVWKADNNQEWHLVDFTSNNVSGYDISPKENNNKGLNSYGGAGNELKLYSNGDKGNQWNFSIAGNTPLNIEPQVIGTPYPTNYKIGEVALNYGGNTSSVEITLNSKATSFLLPENTQVSMHIAGTQYKGYKFLGFQVGDEMTDTLKNIVVKKGGVTVKAVYEVDKADPSQYLFYTYDKEGAPYRIPAITTTKDNKLLVITDKRWCGADIGFGHIDLVGRTSTDNGKTWSEPFMVADGSGIQGAKDCGYGDAAIVTDRESGKILIMCCTGNVFYGNGNRNNPLRSAQLYSEDNGKTWSKPKDITDMMYGLVPNAQGLFIGAGKITQSRYIKVGDYYRIYAALCTRPGGNYVIYSDDFGKTWKNLGSNTTSCAPGGDEPKCEELPDGSVVLSSRKGGGRWFNIFTYTDQAKAEGKWASPVSSNNVSGGLSFGGNSTNGEIQLLKVINKKDNSFNYMMLQSIPTGGGRSHVSIFYKVFQTKSLNNPTELAQGWTKGMEVTTKGSAYSTMCIQPDNKLGFYYEEEPNFYCMIYRPVSIEELTDSVYRMYDPATDPDEEEAIYLFYKNQAKKLLDDNADKHSAKPGLGEYTDEAYKALQDSYDEATQEDYAALIQAIPTFKASANWPVFLINNLHSSYGKGKSIYDNGGDKLYFKKSDKNNKQMWWKFEGLAKDKMENGKYVVTNMDSKKLFWGASFLEISSTNPASEGQFIIKTDGQGDPVHAQESGSVIVRWNNYNPNSGSAWDFTYVGTSFDLLPPSTGIEDIEYVTEENNVIYNLNGQVVKNPTQKGIYIKNNKKFIVK